MEECLVMLSREIVGEAIETYVSSVAAAFAHRTAFVLVSLCLIGTGCSNGPSSRVSESASESAGISTVHLVDVTAEAGLAEFKHRTGAFGEKLFPETMGSGGGFLDYDGDGWQDVVLVGGGIWPGHQDSGFRALWLYRNNGDGTFSLRTDEAGLADVDTYGFGFTAADYDNDGDDDFFLTALRENLLFRNDGGRFAEVGKASGIANVAEWSSAAVFIDVDLDGWLDLYVGNYVAWSEEKDIWCTLNGTDKNYCTPRLYEGIAGRFYYNRGDGTFEERSADAGIAGTPGKTLGAVELDLNDDGWPDLAVANDQERDLLFVNNGDGTFAETGLESGIAFDENGMARSGMGIDAGVIDTTGEVTLFVGNFSREMIGVFRHLRDGLFIDRSAASGIGQPSLLTLTFGLFLFDVELDGDLDLFAANGEVRENIEEFVDGITYRQRPQLFVNDGHGSFREAAQTAGPMARDLVARGAAYADYDRDGDLDVLLTENGGPAHLWRNDTGGGSVRVQLEGRTTNRLGIGADVIAFVGDRRMVRRIRSGSTYLSQPELIATFGLREHSHLDSIVVNWPSGTTDRLLRVEAGAELTVVEGAGARPAQQPPMTPLPEDSHSSGHVD